MSLAGLFEKTNLKINSEDIAILEQYAELVLKWNSTRNLVSRNTDKKQINEHIFDCACITPHLDENKILDVGTGAGLPGIVVSILESKKNVTLLEPNRKKVSFLTHVSKKRLFFDLAPVKLHFSCSLKCLLLFLAILLLFLHLIFYSHLNAELYKHSQICVR